MNRVLVGVALLVVGVVLPTSRVASNFTEYEDQPYLEPGGSETNDLSSPEPVPFDGQGFGSAYPNGLKLIRGNLDASDIDSYEIVVNADDMILAALFDDLGGAGLDPVLGLFSGGAPPAIAEDDDGANGLLSRLSLVAPGAGAFQVGVSGFGDTSFDGSHGEAASALQPYRLVLGVTSDPPPVRDLDISPGPQGSNDVLANAGALPAAGALVGGRIELADVDYYSIEVEEGDRLLVAVYVLRDGAFEPAGGELHDPVVGLFDPLGVPAAAGASDDGHLGFDPGLAFTVPASQGGKWSLAVSGYADSAFDGTHAEGPFDYLLLVARERACPNVTTGLYGGLWVSTDINHYAVAALQEGDHYYTDRHDAQSHVLVDLPPETECGESIKTRFSFDRNTANDPHLTFTLPQAASVYIGFDNRATSDPPWLAAGFTPMGQVIDISVPDPTHEFNLLRRDFAAGFVSLGGNQPSGASSTYIVIAKPLDVDDPAHAFQIEEPVPTGIASVTISGVTINVGVSAGQSASDVATALAAAVNADPSLQALRIFGLGEGPVFVATKGLEAASITPMVLPTAGPVAWVALAILLYVIAFIQLRGQSHRRPTQPVPSSDH